MGIEAICRWGEKILACRDYPSAKEQFGEWQREVRSALDGSGLSESRKREIGVKLHFVENEFSMEDSRRELDRAIRGTVEALGGLAQRLEESFTGPMAELIVQKILRNFYLYIRTMYQTEVHKKATIGKELLEQIQIGNEYDVQRMLLAIIRPVFPAARAEVVSDNGYSGMRCDLYIDEYDLAIEVKCTRKNMTEKMLTEQLGADGFLYDYHTIYMLIYDKEGIVENPAAFENMLKREYDRDGRQVRAFVVQPATL